MQVPRTTRSIGVRSAVAAIVPGLAVCGAWPASAESSRETQYLDIGLQFGAGFEYRIWKAFNLGMDARYHLTANMTNTNNSYYQVGPYVGIAF